MSDDVNVENQLKLVASILGATYPENDYTKNLERFENLLNNDYAEFVRKEDTFTDDAGALRKMQNVLASLKEIASFPMLATKNIVAVAGGFSSGKSQFLNTFFKNKDVQLSVGINPVTAIPTYINAGEKPCITAFTPDGRQGNIPAQIFSKIDHQLIDSLHFNLKSIMPNVTVTTQFNDNVKDFTNLCFVDTPGYNPAGENTIEDKGVAYETLKSASVILWAIPIDSGTVHQTDFNILNKVMDENENKKIFVVCTKADLKKPSQVQEVMEKIGEDFDKADIEIAGITAISARGELKEIEYENEPYSIFDFLSEQNKIRVNTILRCREITQQIDEVFEDYRNSINNKIKEINEKKKLAQEKSNDFRNALQDYENKISEIRMQLLRERSRVKLPDVPDFDIDYREFIDDKTTFLKKNLEEIERLNKEMKRTVYKIFPEMKCPECGKKIEQDSSFCEGCGKSLLGEEDNHCPNCGTEFDEETKFCQNCGKQVR